MSFQLVIAEKPSVARSIAAVIGADEKQNGYWQGGGYLVSWCIGHLVSFAEAGQYDEKYCKWKYEDLPILPQPWQFIVPDEKKQQFEIVRSLLNRPDVASVTAATDAGREGELIFRFVYQMAGCTKPVKRLPALFLYIFSSPPARIVSSVQRNPYLSYSRSPPRFVSMHSQARSLLE